MDVLSEVLKVVKLQGAVFYNGEFSSPWSFCSPPSYTVAPHVAPAAGHVIIYHLLTEVHASARLVVGERIILDAGDIVIFPHGDAHFASRSSASRTRPTTSGVGFSPLSPKRLAARGCHQIGLDPLAGVFRQGSSDAE
jgi:hypothetical protein